jgi:hypothetical protein
VGMSPCTQEAARGWCSWEEVKGPGRTGLKLQHHKGPDEEGTHKSCKEFGFLLCVIRKHWRIFSWEVVWSVFFSWWSLQPLCEELALETCNSGGEASGGSSDESKRN